MTQAQDIVNFWLYDVGRPRWFRKDPALDQQIHARFADSHTHAIEGKWVDWEKTPEGVLALLLLLNPFPRRMFRGTPQAFASDDHAMELARNAIIKHLDTTVKKECKLLFYLPFLTSESKSNQRLALFYIRERTQDAEGLNIAERSSELIDHFGRFPHRNNALARPSTPEEMLFLSRAVNDDISDLF